MTGFLIVSDTHAFVPKDGTKRPSLLPVSSHADEPNLIRAIGDLLEREGLTPDWILCPGDLGDMASNDGQTFVWDQLNQLKSRVGAHHLLGAAGNHDMDSRFASVGYDPKDSLQALRPPFPGLTQAESDQYWARHYCCHTDGDCRIVNLNSSAFHGYGKEDGLPKEFEHGRVKDRTIDEIVAEVSKADFRVNILLTHHHVIGSDHIYPGESSELRGGNRLMHKLLQATSSSWIVIHGHLHYPELDYGRGSALAPIVLSAGSASAINYSGSSESTPNQIYYLDIADPNSSLDGWNPCGLIQSWYWSADGKWERSHSRHKIPYGTGFGSRLNPKQAADRFEAILANTGEPYILFGEAFDADPMLRHLLPSDVELAVKELRRRSYTVTMADLRSDSTIRK